jgi:hypothetical protein
MEYCSLAEGEARTAANSSEAEIRIARVAVQGRFRVAIRLLHR